MGGFCKSFLKANVKEKLGYLVCFSVATPNNRVAEGGLAYWRFLLIPAT